MNDIDNKIEQLKPFTKREQEIFKLGAYFVLQEVKKKKRTITKSMWV